VDENVRPPVARGALRAFAGNQLTILLIVLVALVVFFSVKNPIFYGVPEISNLIIDFSGLVLLAIAETYVIISGGIDLSVGSTVAISGVVGAALMNHFQSHMGLGYDLLLGTLICLAVGTLVGVVNALLITIVNLVPFVATLVTLSAGVGVALVLSGGGDVGDNQAAIVWSSTGWKIFTWEDLIVLALALLLCVVLHTTRYGRYNFAIGSNPFAARAAGINVARHVASVYILAGALAGLTGMFFYIRIGAGASTTGATTNLQAIACVVIGGVALTGGSGNILGTLLGCAILTVVGDGLVFINVAPTWNQVVVGAIIAVAAGLQAIRFNIWKSYK
jgi:ribose transport system permease protein